ncbi:MAG: ABC transporter permease [Ruminococcaceae bacterium]|nr:ABC transporter permease [Oscillospiraceae bacterium]
MNRKHKLTVNQLAVGNLKMRKKQYIVLIVGIILSIAFSASILFFYTASRESTEERRKENLGEQQFIVFDSEGIDLSALYKVNPNLETATVKNVAFAYLTAEEREYGMCIAVADEEFRIMSRQTLADGRLPETEGEIAVEVSALSKMQLDVQLGDTFTVFAEIPDGNGGVLETVEQTYTLVGILTDKCRRLRYEHGWSREHYTVYNDYPAAYLADTATVSPGGKAVQLTYGKWDQSTGRMVTKLYNETAFTEQEVSYNTEFFYDGYYSAEDTTGFDMLYLMCFLGAVLVVGSCFGIVSAFNMNLQERRRQIGLLRAVGTTKRQIVNIFGREAFLIALCSVPAGLLISYFGVWIAVKVMGDGYSFKPAWYVFVLSALLGIAVVMLAAMIPLLTATRITPMQALRNTDIAVKMKRRKIKTQTQFRAPNLLASREIRLRGVKQSGMAVFLSLGILLATLGTSALLEEFKDSFRSPTDFYLVAQQSYLYGWVNVDDDAQWFTESDTARILANPYVKDMYISRATSVCLDAGYLTPYMMHTAGQYAYDFGELDDNFDTTIMFAPDVEDMTILPAMREFLNKTELPDTAFTSTLFVVDDKAAEALLENSLEGNADLDDIHSGKQVIMVAPKGYYMIVHGNGGWGSSSITSRTTKQQLDSAERVVYKDAFYAGDKMTLHWLNGPLEYEEYLGTDKVTHIVKEVEIGAVVDSDGMDGIEAYHSQGMFTNGAVITTERGMRAMGIDAGIRNIDVNLYDNTDETAQTTVNNLLKEVGTRVTYYYLFSNYEYAQLIEQDRAEVVIMLTALLMLFFCITAATLCNTTNARIRESRRIIGTLRAVGASAADLRKIYWLQYLYVFGIGCGVGYGGTALFRFGIFVYEKIMQTTFFMHNITLWPSFVFVGALLTVCVLNLAVRLRRETKNSIVENIREL